MNDLRIFNVEKLLRDIRADEKVNQSRIAEKLNRDQGSLSKKLRENPGKLWVEDFFVICEMLKTNPNDYRKED